MQRARFRHGTGMRLVLSLGWSDFVMRYHGTTLGVLWIFVRPILRFAVFYLLFENMLGSAIPHYALYLLIGLIVWEFFASVTAGCIGMLHQKRSIIQKIPVPRILLVLSLGWTHLIVLAAHALLIAILMVVLGIPASPAIVFLPIFLLQICALSLGIGMTLSAFSLRYRDIDHLWQLTIQLLFWLTPIFYRPALLQSRIGLLIDVQPLSLLLHNARGMILYGAGADWSPALSAYFSVACIGIFTAGAWLFMRRSKHFAEEY